MLQPNSQLQSIAKQSFHGVGMPTPQAVHRKIFYFDGSGETAVIMIDAARCTTTLLAALAAGARAIYVVPKWSLIGQPNQYNPTSLHNKIFPTIPYTLAGELHGKPISGTAFGNSPRSVKPDVVEGKVIYFRSTNFGAAFQALTTSIQESGKRWYGDIYMASLCNVWAVATTLARRGYGRYLIIGGGFYNNISLEDLIVGGRILSHLGMNDTLLDDDALLMRLLAQQINSDAKLLTQLQNNWIGRALRYYGMEADIPAIVTGQGIHPTIYKRMQQIVPRLKYIQGIPYWMPNDWQDNIHITVPIQTKDGPEETQQPVYINY